MLISSNGSSCCVPRPIWVGRPDKVIEKEEEEEEEIKDPN